MFDEEGKSLAEQQAESQQRAYETGVRYGYLDARGGRPRAHNTSAQMGLSGREAELYDQGWLESYTAYMDGLNAPGHHLSVPSLVPGENMAVTTTGRTRISGAGVMFVEAITPTGSVANWYPVDKVRVIR